MKIKDRIYRIISSEKYKESIQKIAKNYFNLKQEFWFRNLLLEELNFEFEKNNEKELKAIAEHPRINKKRVDLSIINQKNIDTPYKIEFKYQYSGDLSNHKRTGKLIEDDYIKRGSDMFILIVLNFSSKDGVEKDKNWGIKNGISKYISKSEKWIENLNKSISTYAISNEIKEINHNIFIEDLEYNYKIIIISNVR